jgi:cytidylate kinase
MQVGVDLGNEGQLLDVLRERKFESAAAQDAMTVRIDGADVTERIRNPELTANARHAASSEEVPGRLVQMQREFATGHVRVVTEGRGQGTVVFLNRS